MIRVILRCSQLHSKQIDVNATSRFVCRILRIVTYFNCLWEMNELQTFVAQ
jgi:hypothetical protein